MVDEGIDSHLDHLFSFHAAMNKSGRCEKIFFPVHLPLESSGLNSVFSSLLGSGGKKGAGYKGPVLAELVSIVP